MAFHPNSVFLNNVTSDIQTQINSISGTNISQSSQILAISGQLNSLISITGSFATNSSVANSISGYTPLTTTATISSSLNSLTFAASANSYIQAINNLTPLIVSISSNVSSNTSQINSISGQLNSLISITGSFATGSTANLSGYTSLSTTSSISGYLNSQIATISASFTSMGEPRGFENKTSSNISFNESSLLFAISGNYNIWNNTIKYQKTGDVYTIPNSSNQYFFYYDTNGNFTVSNSAWNILTDVPIALLVYNSTDGKGILLEERHGIIMDSVTHKYLHSTRGTQLVSLGAIGNYTPASTSPVTSNQSWTIGSTIIADEDNQSTLVSSLSGNYTGLYRFGSGTEWRISTGLPLPFLTTTNIIAYNLNTGGTWSLPVMPNTPNTYMNYYVVAVPAISSQYQYVVIPGQTTYTTLALAQAETISNLNLSGLPFAEFVFIYQVTYRYNAAYSTNRARIEAVSSINYNTVTSGITPASNHNSLSGLQGGTPGEYYHLTAAQNSDFIGRTEVSSISASLTLLTTTATLTGQLAVDSNVVHRTNNETISGNKTFINDTYHSGNVIISGGTALNIVDRGVGALPSSINSNSTFIRLAQIDGNGIIGPGIEGTTFSGSAAGACLGFYGDICSGTRASPSGTLNSSVFYSMGSFGHDNSSRTGQSSLFRTLADGDWNPSNHGTYFQWASTPNGSLSRTEWMRLQNASLGIGIIPVTGNGSLQVGGMTTIDLGSGTLPTAISPTSLVLSNVDGSQNRISGVAYNAQGINIAGRVAGGSRASPSSTLTDSTFVQLSSFGYDTSYSVANAGLYAIKSGSVWTTGNHETYHIWTGTSNNSLSSPEWMRLQNAELGIGMVPISGQGRVQIASDPLQIPGGLSLLLQGNLNKERIGIRSNQGPVFVTQACNNTVESPTAVTNNLFLGSYQVGGYKGDAWTRGAQIGGIADADWNPSSVPASIVFYTSPVSGNSVLLERMRLNSDGILGLGLTPVAGNGTAQISGNLMVNYSGSTPLVGVAGITNIGAPATNTSFIGQSFSGATLYLGYRTNGNPSSPTNVVANDNLTLLGGAGRTTSGAYTGSTGLIAIKATETFVSASNAGTAITFEGTSTGAWSRSEWARFQDGALGIGCTPTNVLGVFQTQCVNAPSIISGQWYAGQDHKVWFRPTALSSGALGAAFFTAYDDLNNNNITGSVRGVYASAQTWGSATKTTATQFGVSVSTNVYNTGSSGTVTSSISYGIYVQPVVSAAAGSAATIGSYYALLIDTPALFGPGTATIGNRWGLYQSDSLTNNYFGGNVTCNNALNCALTPTVSGSYTVYHSGNFTGGSSLSISSVQSSSFTISSDVSLCNSSGDSGFTATLPTAVGVSGKSYYIKKVDAYTNKVRVATTSSQTIDGSTYFDIINQYDVLRVVSDGANWQII